MPKARPYTSKFFSLSYHNPDTGNYAAGHDDMYFMAFCIVLLTGLRAGAMEYVLAPLAKLWGISKRKMITRFSEQGWMLMYYNLSWPVGMVSDLLVWGHPRPSGAVTDALQYVYYNSPYFMNMRELWTDWPQRELGWMTKAYILGQFAFWLQQVLVINIEDRRKDHWQMLTHHFITIALMGGSYAYHQTRVGHVILLLMDVIDLIFPVSSAP